MKCYICLLILIILYVALVLAGKPPGETECEHVQRLLALWIIWPVSEKRW